jgi:hypothetical protein
MRLPAAFALSLSLSLCGAALADDDARPEHGAALEKAERMEREGRALLEKGKKADGADLLAKAWHLRARVWAADGPHAGGKKEGKGDDGRLRADADRDALGEHLRRLAEAVAKSTHGEGGDSIEARRRLESLAQLALAALHGKAANPEEAERVRKAAEEALAAFFRGGEPESKGRRDEGKEHPLREARRQAAHLDEKAREAKAAGRHDEAERLHAKAEAVRAEARRAHGRGEDRRGKAREEGEGLRRRIAEMKERSEALERKAKALREDGRLDSARDAMRMSGEAWAEARELERRLDSRHDRKGDDLPDPRGGDDAMRRAKEQATFVERTGRVAAPRLRLEAVEPGRHVVVLRGEEHDGDVRQDLARLREEMKTLRTLVERLREELGARRNAER